MNPNQLISVDWGTSNLRIRLVSLPELRIEEERSFFKGIKLIHQEWTASRVEREEFYLRYLKNGLDQFRSIIAPNAPIIISGMASSSIGFRELPYAQLPLDIKGNKLHIEPVKSTDIRHPIWVISGVRTNLDVIRGEEVQVIGLVEMDSSTPQLFILPGTHSKHILVREGHISEFKTYMTGELFEVIKQYTVLSNSVQKGPLGKAQRLAFKAGVKKAYSGDSILHMLFLVRTNQLFDAYTELDNYYFLSGLLIAEELKGLKENSSLKIKICAGSPLAELYELAIEALGLADQTEVIAEEVVDHAVIKGQSIILNQLINQ